MKKRFLQNLILVIISVFLLFLIIKYQLGYLIWIAFIPVFYGIRKSNFKDLTALIIIYSILINLTSLNWFWDYRPEVMYSSIAIISIFGIFLIKITEKVSKSRTMEIISFPIIWTILVFIFSFNPLGSIWVNFAFFYPTMAPLIWFIGGIGITFLIILFNSLVADYFLKKDKKVLIMVIVILAIILFCYNYSNQEYKTDNQLKVALIQGNMNQTWIWRVTNIGLIIDKYEQLSITASKENPDYIIWPEYSIPIDIFRNQTVYNRLSNLAKKTNSYLVFGTSVYLPNQSNSLVKIQTDTLLVFSPDGELIGRYDSRNPMPFDRMAVKGEKIYSDNLIKTDKAALRVGLCFEELKIRSFHGESDFIISSVNNRFFDDTSGLKLVSQISRLIAAENKKYLVRVSNTGITQIINPYGMVISKIDPHIEGILIENIYI